MPTSNDFPARGKIIEVRGSIVVFQPSATTYQLHLEFSGEGKAEVSAQPIECFIHVEARKVHTVPSGGNFISPIFGPPRIVQGRVRYADQNTLVIHAGTPIIVKLPEADTAINLSSGKIQVGHMVNVVADPKATFQFAGASAAAR